MTTNRCSLQLGTVFLAIVVTAAAIASDEVGGRHGLAHGASLKSPSGLESPPDAPPGGPSLQPRPGQERALGGVYLFSGEYYLACEDLRIPGRGLDFVWARKYRSRCGPTTAQGNGWDFAYNIRVALEGSGIRLFDGNTRSDLYSLQGNGTYTAAEFFREGTLAGNGTFTLVFADTGRWVFRPLDGSTAQGKIDRIVDRNGNAITFHYDALGRQDQITDTLGHIITVAYNADGYLAGVTDFTGRQVQYQYYHDGDASGAAGDLKSVTSPAVTGTPNGNDFPVGKTTTYTYSQSSVSSALNHNLLTITSANGEVQLVNAYAPTLDENHPEFDHVVRQLSGTPPAITEISYQQQSGNTLATVNDPVGHVSELTYDATNRLATRRDFTGLATPHRRTTPGANRPLKPLRPSDPPFFETHRTYNADGLVTHTVHANGNETLSVFQLDLDANAAWRSRGNLREVHRYPGSHTPAGDQAALHELYEYDPATNFITKATDASGGITGHQYDTNGNRVHTDHPIPTVVEDLEYDSFGQMTTHTAPPDGSGNRRVNTFQYYATGPQKGRLRRVAVDAGGLDLTTRYEYDAVGNVTGITDPREKKWLYVYNSLDQVVRAQSPPVAGTPYRRDFFYDANDNLVRVDTQNVDENGQLRSNATLTTSYQYDGLDRMVQMAREVDQTHDVVTNYAYDAAGQLVLKRSGEASNGNQPGNAVEFVWDGRGRLFQSIRAPGTAAQSTTQYDYDGNGNTISVHHGLEDDPRVATTTFDAYDRPVQYVDAMGNNAEYHYDAGGNTVSRRVLGELVDGIGSTAAMRLAEESSTFDPLHRRTQRQMAFFDLATQLPIGDGLATAAWQYDDRSRVTRTTDDNGHQLAFEYDAADRLLSAMDARGNTTSQTYDDAGNPIQVTQVEKSDVGSPDQTLVTTFTYDNLNRATSETDTLGHAITYAHDSLDNSVRVTDRNGNHTSASYDGLGRRLTTTQEPGDGSQQITIAQTWDDNSRVTTQIDGNGHATLYTYDDLDRVASRQHADGTGVTYGGCRGIGPEMVPRDHGGLRTQRG